MPVRLPPQAFLQSTREGEMALQDHVLKIVGKAKAVADLFCGVGTFALPLAKKAKVHAVEQDKAALAGSAQAARSKGLKPVTTEARDLFKRPLTAPELAPSTPWCWTRRGPARKRKAASWPNPGSRSSPMSPVMPPASPVTPPSCVRAATKSVPSS